MEEKKNAGLEEVAKEEAPTNKAIEAEEPESDFADEMKKEEPAPEPIKEEEPKEEAIDLHLEEEPVKEEPSVSSEEPVSEEKKEANKKEKKTVSYNYDDERLEKIETARLAFNKEYKKSNLWKWLVTVACLVLIILGWVLTMIPEINNGLKQVNEQFPMIFTLILVGISLVALLIFSSVFKKKIDKLMQGYFKTFYECQNAYIYPAECENLEGEATSKLDDKYLKESGIYKDIARTGSRACLSFDYMGKRIVISDAAAQVQEKKALRTVFVGKFLYFENDYKGEDILVYFKGNKRALPPTNLAGRNLFKDSKTMVIYGPATSKKTLNARVMNALNAFETNATFVDMAVSIREGMTYIAMGYEDDLMVLPLEKPFNPAPTKEAKKDIGEVLDLIAALNRKEQAD